MAAAGRIDLAEERRIDPSAGVYDTPRAAALSGVPLSTLHYWARKGIYVPGVEPGPRTRLWPWGICWACARSPGIERGKDWPGLLASACHESAQCWPSWKPMGFRAISSIALWRFPRAEI